MFRSDITSCKYELKELEKEIGQDHSEPSLAILFQSLNFIVKHFPPINTFCVSGEVCYYSHTHLHNEVLHYWIDSGEYLRAPDAFYIQHQNINFVVLRVKGPLVKRRDGVYIVCTQLLEKH